MKHPALCLIPTEVVHEALTARLGLPDDWAITDIRPDPYRPNVSLLKVEASCFPATTEGALYPQIEMTVTRLFNEGPSVCEVRDTNTGHIYYPTG